MGGGASAYGQTVLSTNSIEAHSGTPASLCLRDNIGQREGAVLLVALSNFLYSDDEVGVHKADVGAVPESQEPERVNEFETLPVRI